jgi:hypothetical protein
VLVRFPLLAVVMAAAFVIAGCSGDSEAPPASTKDVAIRSQEDLLVTKADVARAGAGTPGAAVLRWWQSLQFQDFDTARQAYGPAAGTDRLSRQMKKLAPILSNTRLVLQEQEVSGTNARVLAVMRSATFQPPKVFVSDQPTTFKLSKIDGEWKLPDNAWLDERYAAQLGADRAARRQSSPPSRRSRPPATATPSG